MAEREALTELLSFVEAHNVDKVLIYECSRLSRRVADFINIVDRLNELHISLYIHPNGLETLQADGMVNPIAQLIIGILCSSIQWKVVCRTEKESSMLAVMFRITVVCNTGGLTKSAFIADFIVMQ